MADRSIFCAWRAASSACMRAVTSAQTTMNPPVGTGCCRFRFRGRSPDTLRAGASSSDVAAASALRFGPFDSRSAESIVPLRGGPSGRSRKVKKFRLNTQTSPSEANMAMPSRTVSSVVWRMADSFSSMRSLRASRKLLKTRRIAVTSITASAISAASEVKRISFCSASRRAATRVASRRLSAAIPRRVPHGLAHPGPAFVHRGQHLRIGQSGLVAAFSVASIALNLVSTSSRSWRTRSCCMWLSAVRL